jgi:hypothetical protein
MRTVGSNLEPMVRQAHLSVEKCRRRVQELEDRIVEETAARHRAKGHRARRCPVGAALAASQAAGEAEEVPAGAKVPCEPGKGAMRIGKGATGAKVPGEPWKSSAPLVHTAIKDARRRFRNAYVWFALEYRRVARAALLTLWFIRAPGARGIRHRPGEGRGGSGPGGRGWGSPKGRAGWSRRPRW